MVRESLVQDIRYALRGLRTAPLIATSVAGTIGIGLGLLSSAFTIVNAYLLKPIDLPAATELYALSWDSASTRRHRFRPADVDALRESSPVFAAVAAGHAVTVMDDGNSVMGLVVTGNYFQTLGARAVMGRTILPEDAATPRAGAVVVLSHNAWRVRYAADPAIVGKEVALGRHRYHVIGVLQPGASLSGDETVSFWAPLTTAYAFGAPDPWENPDVPALSVIARLAPEATESQAGAWFDAWLRQRYPPGSDSAPIMVRVESRATRIPLNAATLTMLSLIVAAFGLVLLVACANVTNIMLARGLSRQHEIAVRLSLGAGRWRIVRQLVIESLVLAVPAAAVGLGLTLVTARVFPSLLLNTLPEGAPAVGPFLAPFDPDIRVLGLLFGAAVIAAVVVGLSPAMQITKATLMRVAKGRVGVQAPVSRLRSGLIVMQIAACALFLVGATGLIDESRRLARPEVGLEYERVIDVRVAADLRAAVFARLASDPSHEAVAVAWRPPLAGPLRSLRVMPTNTGLEYDTGFMAVSPEYFGVYGIRLVRGRAFTAQEVNRNAALVIVSAATARRFWPGQDPIGQTLDILPSRERRERRPAHGRVHVVGVAEDVTSGWIGDGIDATCVYVATSASAAGDMSILVRARKDPALAKASIAAAVRDVQPDATFDTYQIKTMVGMQVWAFQVFSAAAAVLGAVGLLLAFSGTYAVMAFLVAQRTREFGIRMALGATVRRIVLGVIGEGLRLAAVGGGAGLLIAAVLARVSDAAIEVAPTFGPRPFVIGAGIVLVATIAASFLPSLRTARIDPSEALRAE